MVKRCMNDTDRAEISARSFRLYLLKYEGVRVSEIEIQTLCLERLARFGMLEERPRGSGVFSFTELYN